MGPPNYETEFRWSYDDIETRSICDISDMTTGGRWQAGPQFHEGTREGFGARQGGAIIHFSTEYFFVTYWMAGNWQSFNSKSTLGQAEWKYKSIRGSASKSCKCHKSKKISSSQSLNGGGLWLTALVVNLWTKLSDVGNSVAPNRRKGNSECSHHGGICICPNFRIFSPSYLREILLHQTGGNGKQIGTLWMQSPRCWWP